MVTSKGSKHSKQDQAVADQESQTGTSAYLLVQKASLTGRLACPQSVHAAQVNSSHAECFMAFQTGGGNMQRCRSVQIELRFQLRLTSLTIRM